MSAGPLSGCSGGRSSRRYTGRAVTPGLGEVRGVLGKRLARARRRPFGQSRAGRLDGGADAQVHALDGIVRRVGVEPAVEGVEPAPEPRRDRRPTSPRARSSARRSGRPRFGAPRSPRADGPRPGAAPHRVHQRREAGLELRGRRARRAAAGRSGRGRRPPRPRRSRGRRRRRRARARRRPACRAPAPAAPRGAGPRRRRRSARSSGGRGRAGPRSGGSRDAWRRSRPRARRPRPRASSSPSALGDRRQRRPRARRVHADVSPRSASPTERPGHRVGVGDGGRRPALPVAGRPGARPRALRPDSQGPRSSARASDPPPAPIDSTPTDGSRTGCPPRRR